MTERLHLHFHALEKEMATHSSVLPWRIPGTGEPGGLPSMGSQSRTQLKRLSSSSSSSGPEVENLPANAGNMGSISSPWEDSTCHRQLSPWATITEPLRLEAMSCNYCTLEP